LDALDLVVNNFWCQIQNNDLPCDLKSTDEKLVIFKKDGTPFKKGSVLSLFISYTGKISTTMNGLYRSEYINSNGEKQYLLKLHFPPRFRYILSTQLEPSGQLS
jgi:hypothetical protein